MSLPNSGPMGRRTLLLALAGAGAMAATSQSLHAQRVGREMGPPRWLTEPYAAVADEPFPIAAIDVHRIDRRYLRQLVSFRTPGPTLWPEPFRITIA